MAKASCVIADPPWHYQNWTDKKNGAAVSNYDTMALEEIARLPINEWVDKNAILALWCTWPKLTDGLYVANAWGFEYVSGFPWVKTTPAKSEIYTGIGFWAQSCSEIVMICRRGKPKTKRSPVLGLLTEEDRQFYAPATRKHSRKPYGLHEYLEDRCSGPYLELFATEQRQGWTCLGLSLGTRLSEHGVEECAPVPHK